MRETIRRFLHAFCVLALAIAQISPACAFVSGDYIQICAADGTIKTIAVEEAGEAAQALLAIEGGPSPAPDHHETKDQCPFCMSAQNVKAAFVASHDALFSPALSHHIVLTKKDSGLTPGSVDCYAYKAQAPPTSLL